MDQPTTSVGGRIGNSYYEMVLPISSYQYTSGRPTHTGLSDN